MDPKFVDELQSSFTLNLIYDLIKIFMGYIFARLAYENVFKKWRYGGWSLLVTRDGHELARRKLSPKLAENVLENDNDLSVYVKGVVSFHEWLRMDICSPQARELGLLRLDKKAKTITVDLDNNPPDPRRRDHTPDAGLSDCIAKCVEATRRQR
jgi:hypothetical protein